MATSIRLLTDYVSVDAATGEALSGFDHLLASIRDILSTRIGSRRMRPTYGCRSADRLGAPLNASTTADLIADVAEAIFQCITHVAQTGHYGDGLVWMVDIEKAAFIFKTT